MTVTEAIAERPALECADRVLTDEQVASIHLAVAQWMRSARGVVEAADKLRAMRVPPDEIFRRRRAESADTHVAALLRLAVTLVITHGTLEPSDSRRFALLGDGVVQAVAQHAADARRNVSAIERRRATPAPVIDLDVGDY